MPPFCCGENDGSPASTNLCHACNHPMRALVWPATTRSTAESRRSLALWFVLCCCACPGACNPRFCSRHSEDSHPHMSHLHLSRLQPLRGTMLTTCLSLRRGHHLEHLLCQGCHGKRLRLRTSSSPRLAFGHRLECCAFPASGSVTITSVENQPGPYSQGRGDTSAIIKPLASSPVPSPDVGCCFYAVLVVSAICHATRHYGCQSPFCQLTR